MSLLASHLDQISISCRGIKTLPFPPSRIFSNALLSNHDITSLIRDTEPHERALFSVPPPPPAATSQNPDPPHVSTRRETVFNVAGGEVTTGPSQKSSRGPPRRNTAVAAVLGGNLHTRILRRGGDDAKGDIDVDVLLHGAEKLCNVYPLPGALEHISAQRQKKAQQINTLAYYESKVAEQQEALESMNKDHWMSHSEEIEIEEDSYESGVDILTGEDLRREEEELRELEWKKRELQERLHAMTKDLGGLLDI